eukprot:9468455-Pyramimonas_sp.AAC.2
MGVRLHLRAHVPEGDEEAKQIRSRHRLEEGRQWPMHPGDFAPRKIQRTQTPTTSPEAAAPPMQARAITEHMHIEERVASPQGPDNSLFQARARQQPGWVRDKKSGPEQRDISGRLS